MKNKSNKDAGNNSSSFQRESEEEQLILCVCVLVRAKKDILAVACALSLLPCCIQRFDCISHSLRFVFW